MKTAIIFITLMLIAYTCPAEQDAPILTIESGGHTAIVRGLIFTPDGRQLISAGDDKVIRIWDAGTGELIRTLRGQIGAGPEGKIYAIAISPDGEKLAAGGYSPGNDNFITISNIKTGAVTKILRGHTNVIYALAFSPDGRWLASGSNDNTVKLWEISTGKPVQTLEGHQERINGLAFSPDSEQLVSASYDKTLRLWSVPDGRLLREMTGHSAEVQCVAYSPDGRYIASGSYDNTIRLWDGHTGEFIKVAGRHDAHICSVSFSPDSQRLVSASGGTGRDYRSMVWRIPLGELVTTFSKHDNTVLASTFSPDGKIVATAGGGNNDIYLWDAGTGEVRKQIVGIGKVVWSVAFANDGEQFAYGNVFQTNKLNEMGPLEHSFDLMGMSLTDISPEDKRWKRVVTEYSGLALKCDDEYKLSIMRGDKEQAVIKLSSPYDAIRCYSFTPSGDIVIGSAYTLALYDSSGKRKSEFIGHIGEVRSVSVSGDGRYLISGSDDQTVRLWNIQTGELLVSFFIGDNRDWVAWTPAGYYKASAGGDKLIGWHVNRGEENAAEYYYAYQFRRKFYRPDVLERILEEGSVEKAVASANANLPKEQQVYNISDIRKMEPPKVAIISPGDNTTVSEPQVKVKARIISDTEVTEITITVNGRPAWRNEKGFKRKPAIEGESLEQTVTLESGKNTISVIARNENAVSQPISVVVTYNKPQVRKPNLYILAIGVSKYADGSYDLLFADKDARTIADIFKAQKGMLFGNVSEKVLLNSDATKDNILDGLDWMLKESTQKDVSIVFISGHGMQDNQGNYYFFTYNGDENSFRRTCVNWSEFQNALSSLPSKVLLFTDTCKAGSITGRTKGSFDMTEIIADLASDESGVVVMASSTGRESSLEDAKWGHGAFTLALKEGLSGKADYDKDGAIYITEINNYVISRVKELTDGKQHPTSGNSTTMRSFPIVLLNR